MKPRLSQPDGTGLRPALQLLHAISVRSSDPNGLVQRYGWWFVRNRLPAMVASYRDGRRFLVPRGDAMYGEVFMRGAYEPAASRVIAQLLREDDFAIDVGANHGWFSLLMAARVGGAGRVWAFEPVPPVLAALRENVSRNDDLPIEVFPIALSADSGQLELHLFSGLPHGHASASTLGREDYETFPVPTRRLDDLVDEADGRVPALVKVDVEGAELEVLRGAERLAAEERPPIWVLEVNYETSVAFGHDPPDLLTQLQTAGEYRVYRIQEDGLRPESDPGSAPHGALWVCVPPASEERLAGVLA